MSLFRNLTIGLFAILALSGCSESGGQTGAADDGAAIVNVYNWSDYIASDVLTEFEQEFGIRVNYDIYDSSEIVDSKLLAGATGYDVILHDTQLIARLIPLGIFEPINRAQLPNYDNLDRELLDTMTFHDPGNTYSVPYMWGTVGFAYNVEMIEARMSDAPVDSAAFVFDPEIVSKFADCGVTFLDSPSDVIPMVLAYLGHDVNSMDDNHLAEAEAVLQSVRPYVKYFSSSRMIIDLPSEEVCIAMSWSGDYAQAWSRAKEANIDIELAYNTPKEGFGLWVDGLVIPEDASHKRNAHIFLNYLMRPDVIARISNYVYYANGNAASIPYLDPEVYSDPAIYPPPEVREVMFVKKVLPPKIERKRTRLWARLKTGI